MHVFYIALAAVFVLYLYIVGLWPQETNKVYLLTYFLFRRLCNPTGG